MQNVTGHPPQTLVRKMTAPWLWLTLPVFIGVLVAALSGFVSLASYANSLNFAAQGQGQDFITLVLVLPLLLASTHVAWRGRLVGVVLWLGCMLYIAYTYAITAFHVEFNALFLIYVLNLGCSFYGILWAVIGSARLQICIDEKTPVRATAIVMCIIMLMFGALWITDTVTAIRNGTRPASAIADNVPTSAVEVLDLGIYLPLLAIGAVMLWRGQPLGVVMSGMALVFTSLMGVAIIAMIVNMTRLELVDSAAQVSVFVPIVIVTTGVLLWLLPHVEVNANGES